MVGQAYSLDYKLGYRYIVIKAYDCDDLSFVDSLTPYQAYRVERGTLKTDLVLPKSGIITKRLSLKHISCIVGMITLAEFDRMYPVAVSWEVTPSGKCICKKIRDIDNVWPVSPLLTDNSLPYINISDMCFKTVPSYLEVSFLCEVLNESAYLCGIYSSDMFVACGNQIFCSMDFASAELKIFGSDTVYSASVPYGTFKLPGCKVSADDIVSHAQCLKFAHGDYLHGNAEGIVNIKRECIESTCHLIRDCLSGSHSFEWLIKRIKVCVEHSIRSLRDYGTELISGSSSALSTDVDYLYYKELLEAFSFADEMQKIPKVVRLKRYRNRNLKKLERPMLIYKGRLYK